MNVFKSVRSIILATYPELWMYTGFLFIFGALVAVKGGSPPSLHILPYLLWFFSGANIFGMLLNDYFDRSLDKHNPRKTKPKLQPREYAYGITAALLSYAVIAVLFPDFYAAVLVVVAVAANAAYSIPPLRLKERPPFDVLGGPASYLSALLSGYVVAAGYWPQPLAVFAGLLFFCGIDLAFKTLDIEADARGGVSTSATILGRTASLIYSAFLVSGAGVLISLYSPLYGLAVLPYLVIITVLNGANNNTAIVSLDTRLPLYYFGAGFVVTLLYWTL